MNYELKTERYCTECAEDSMHKIVLATSYSPGWKGRVFGDHVDTYLHECGLCKHKRYIDFHTPLGRAAHFSKRELSEVLDSYSHSLYLQGFLFL